MRITMLRSIVGEDRTDWMEGETHDASPNFAVECIHAHAAKLADGEAPFVAPPLGTASPAYDNRMVTADARDPKTRRRK